MLEALPIHADLRRVRQGIIVADGFNEGSIALGALLGDDDPVKRSLL